VVTFYPDGLDLDQKPCFLWTVKHDDGECEDLEADELDAAEKLFWTDKTRLLLSLAKCGFVKIGKDTLFVDYKEKRHFGSLNEKGEIVYKNRTFRSLSSWSSDIKNGLADAGWSSAKCFYGGKVRTLYDLRNVLGDSWLRKKQTQSRVSSVASKKRKEVPFTLPSPELDGVHDSIARQYGAVIWVKYGSVWWPAVEWLNPPIPDNNKSIYIYPPIDNRQPKEVYRRHLLNFKVFDGTEENINEFTKDTKENRNLLKYVDAAKRILLAKSSTNSATDHHSEITTASPPKKRQRVAASVIPTISSSSTSSSNEERERRCQIRRQVETQKQQAAESVAHMVALEAKEVHQELAEEEDEEDEEDEKDDEDEEDDEDE
jgi:hypothetical protein